MQQIATNEVLILLFQKLSLLLFYDALQFCRLHVVCTDIMLDILGTCQIIALFRRRLLFQIDWTWEYKIALALGV